MKKNLTANLLFGFAIFLILVVAIPFLLWLVQPKEQLDVFILDKTVPTKARREHSSFHWLLTYNKISNSKDKLYSISDYYGFFPETHNKKDFDFKSITIADVNSLSDSIDLAYYTDLYGVYYNNWYKKNSPQVSPKQKVYGGLNHNDYLLLKELKKKQKTIVTEFILLDKPTSDLVRKKTENLFDFYWEGWVGRCFNSLDTNKNRDFPTWIINLYKEQNNGKWPFSKAGIVFVHKFGKVVVLEEDNHLNHPCLEIETSESFREKYRLPAKLNYCYWFDIVSTGETNKVSASFNIDANQKGDSILNRYSLNPSFPAILSHEKDYRFYYFAGDFADNPIVKETAYFKGVKTIERWLNSDRKCERTNFFWEYYLPLMEGIIENTNKSNP
jgi:hypothetical protein